MDKYKVAIVDDDEVALENLSFELGKDARFFLKGTARNGKQGKKLIAKVQPDLLFLDVELPDMTGMELLQEIRDSVSWNMRIVFYTAYDMPAIPESAPCFLTGTSHSDSHKAPSVLLNTRRFHCNIPAALDGDAVPRSGSQKVPPPADSAAEAALTRGYRFPLSAAAHR